MGVTDSNYENTSGYDTSDPINHKDFVECYMCRHYYRRGSGGWSTPSGYRCSDCDRRKTQRERENKRDRIKIEWDRAKFEFDKLQQKLSESSANRDAINSEMQGINEQIEDEEKKVDNNFKYPEEETNKIVIIIGNTGDGKSTFCNRLAGDESRYGNQESFKTSGQSDACTTDIRYQKVCIDNINICIVDTPGFNDGAGSDRYHANNICKYLKGCGGINSFVLVRNSTNCRFDANFQKLLKQYADIFGAKSFFSNLIVIATKVDYNNDIFNDNKQAQALQNRIMQLAQENYQLNELQPSMINVIPIGFDNYKKSICEFANIIPNKKFVCDAIVSPLTALRKKQQNRAKHQDTILTKYHSLKSQTEEMAKKVNECEKRWNNV